MPRLPGAGRHRDWSEAGAEPAAVRGFPGTGADAAAGYAEIPTAVPERPGPGGHLRLPAISAGRTERLFAAAVDEPLAAVGERIAAAWLQAPTLRASGAGRRRRRGRGRRF